MDAEELKEEIEHQRILQKEHRKNQRTLEQQAATFSDSYVPPHIKNQIDALAEKIRVCEQKEVELSKLLDKYLEDDSSEVLEPDQSSELLRNREPLRDDRVDTRSSNKESVVTKDANEHSKIHISNPGKWSITHFGWLFTIL